MKKFSDRFKLSYQEIDGISQRIDAGLIDSRGGKIQIINRNVAKLTLDQKISGPKNICRKKGNNQKKWFDKECEDLQKNVRQLGKENLM